MDSLHFAQYLVNESLDAWGTWGNRCPWSRIFSARPSCRTEIVSPSEMPTTWPLKSAANNREGMRSEITAPEERYAMRLFLLGNNLVLILSYVACGTIFFCTNSS